VDDSSQQADSQPELAGLADDECGWQQPTGRLTARVGWLGLRVASHLALCLHSSPEWPIPVSMGYNDRTINTDIAIIIIRLDNSTMQMQPTVTDGVAWSVCLSVGLTVTVFSPAKSTELIEMQFGLWTRVRPSKHVLDGVHNGATWQIRLNYTCAAAMQPYIKSLWPLVIITIHYSKINTYQKFFGLNWWLSMQAVSVMLPSAVDVPYTVMEPSSL